MIIAIEGCDGSGKTSVIQGLKDSRIGGWFKYRVFPYLKEEKRTIFNEFLKAFNDPEGEKLRNLLFLQDFLHFDRTRKTDQGYICDRSLLSTLIYTESDRNRKETIDFILKFGIKFPDLIFILDCDPKISMARILQRHQDRPIFRSKIPHEEIVKRYHDPLDFCFFSYLEDMIREDRMIILDKDLSIPDIVDLIVEKILEVGQDFYY